MAESIKDAATGNVMKVDSEQRAHVQSVTIGSDTHANDKGDAYNVNTGEITLTNAVDTPVLYLKNGGTQTVYIHAIAVGLTDTTGGTGTAQPKITIVRNPTAGTIVSGATAVDMFSNRNYGSSKTHDDIVAYKGATGLTMTDGDDHIVMYQGNNGRLFAGVGEELPPGTSIGLKIKPQTSNTAQTVYAAFVMHIADPSI